jgi:hypothetical protein
VTLPARDIAIVVCVVASCGGAAAPLPGRVPADHRTTISTCAPRVGTTALCPSSQASSQCATDPDCVEGGPNGRCVPGIRDTGGASDAACRCVYDRCASDDNCRGQGPCQCTALEVGNSCLTGNCAVDADCGVGGFCSPVADPCTGIVSGYWCHTPRDTCVDNTDCAGQCTYVATDARWECVTPPPCRPPTAAPPMLP